MLYFLVVNLINHPQKQAGLHQGLPSLPQNWPQGRGGCQNSGSWLLQQHQGQGTGPGHERLGPAVAPGPCS